MSWIGPVSALGANGKPLVIWDGCDTKVIAAIRAKAGQTSIQFDVRRAIMEVPVSHFDDHPENKCNEKGREYRNE